MGAASFVAPFFCFPRACFAFLYGICIGKCTILIFMNYGKERKQVWCNSRQE